MSALNIPQAIQVALSHHQAGQLQLAEAIYRQVLQVQPNHADALHLLGLIAHQIGNHAMADTMIGKAIKVKPKVADFYNNWGEASRALGRFDEAIARYQKALVLRPGYVDACYNMGLAFQEQGRLDEAAKRYKQALALKPDLVVAYNNLGNICQELGRPDDAIVYYEKAIMLQPDYPEAHNNLGNPLQKLGRLDDAVACYKRAITLNPDYTDAYNNLGQAFQKQGRFEEAIACYRKALTLKCDYPEVYNNLGIALQEQGKPNEAVVYYEKALELKPDYSDAHCNLGGALLGVPGRLEDAIACYKKAVALRRNYSEAYSNLMMALNYSAFYEPQAVFSEHLGFAAQYEAPFAAALEEHRNERLAGRRIRIGYVSSDFRQHSVAHFIEPVLASHDRDMFEIFCYSGHYHVDDTTRRLQAHADIWRSIVGVSDEKTAQQIREDMIDILVDLSGHTSDNRLLLFMRKPAPIQVTWLGYPNTTGLATMDYRITDRYADPIGMTEEFHTEQLLRLPECFSCYSPPSGCSEVAALPAITNGYVTFGSFNNIMKITPKVISVWAVLLHAVPDSRLTLKFLGLREESTRQVLYDAFAAHGINADRLELLSGDASQSAHFQRYNTIDIGLDPFPYNGTTTTCDALWMGVPVITLAGKTHVARVGVSQMSNLGLQELIAHTPEEYVALAARLAGDIKYLSNLRMELRPRMAASPLMDAKRFTRHLEVAYREMWTRWCESGL